MIGATAIHILDAEKAKKVPKIQDCFVDVGAKSKDEALERLAIGDAVTFVDDFEILHDDVAVARAFDNRVGTFSAIEALRLLAESRTTSRPRSGRCRLSKRRWGGMVPRWLPTA